MSLPRTLMLVSDRADGARRAAVEAGRKPCPEYLRLEQSYGVDLFDWTCLGESASRRTTSLSVRHVRAAVSRLEGYEAVFTDGEHLGIPMALAMTALRRRRPHLVLGHRLTGRFKRPLFRFLNADAGMSRVLLHSGDQLDEAERMGIPRSKLALVPYFADADFWRPQPLPEEPLVVSAGLEHRDYVTLASACAAMPEQVFVAAASVHSPAAHFAAPRTWPVNFTRRQVDHLTLRDWYARASVVVVPLLHADFQAGITTLLEAMAVGKAVVVSANRAHRALVEDGINAVLVPPGDASALRAEVRRLLDDPEARRKIGAAARATVLAKYDLNRFCAGLAGHLEAISSAA
jgi:glycosyltransferase involved in cell wall biosynthesis